MEDNNRIVFLKIISALSSSGTISLIFFTMNTWLKILLTILLLFIAVLSSLYIHRTELINKLRDRFKKLKNRESGSCDYNTGGIYYANIPKYVFKLNEEFSEKEIKKLVGLKLLDPYFMKFLK